MKATFPVFGPNGYVRHVTFECQLCYQERMALAQQKTELRPLAKIRELEKQANYSDFSTAIRAGWLFIQGHGFTPPNAIYPMAVCPRHTAMMFRPQEAPKGEGLVQ